MNTGANTFWSRLRGRFRHGLAMQELLERLAVWRFVCLPYTVTFEDAASTPTLPAPRGVTFRELDAADAPAIVAISLRPRALESTVLALREQRCFGALLDGRLIGYTWARSTSVPLAWFGGTLFPLRDDEAYLLDMFVHPDFRGLRCAPWLRVETLRLFASEGRPNCYSISYLFNRSSRVFKQRLGAVEREWRIALQLDIGPLPGVDVRFGRAGAPLRTQAVLRRPSRLDSARTPS